MMIRISQSHFRSPHEGQKKKKKKSGNFSLMTHSRQIITPIQRSLFFSLMWGRNWKQETLFWWCDWFSFDLTDSRGLSWSIHNGPDLSTAATVAPTINVLSWQYWTGAFFLPLVLFFLPQTKAQMAPMVYLLHRQTLSLCAPLLDVPLIPSQSFSCLKMVSMPPSPSSLWPRVKVFKKVLGFFFFLTVAVILRGWPHWLHTGLYWVK